MYITTVIHALITFFVIIMKDQFHNHTKVGKVQRSYLFLLKQKKNHLIFSALHLIHSYLNVLSKVHVITCAYGRREL